MYIVYVNDRRELGFFCLNESNSIKQFLNLKGKFYRVITIGAFVVGVYFYLVNNSKDFSMVETQKPEISICSKTCKIYGGHIIPEAYYFSNLAEKDKAIPSNDPKEKEID